MCCGEKRAEFRSNSTPATARQTIAQSNPARIFPTAPTAQVSRMPGVFPVPAAAVEIRYLQSAPIQVRGSATGAHYEFSASNPIQSVDRRDAVTLLQTRFFRAG